MKYIARLILIACFLFTAASFSEARIEKKLQTVRIKSPVSSDMPSRFGPRNWGQSAERDSPCHIMIKRVGITMKHFLVLSLRIVNLHL